MTLEYKILWIDDDPDSVEAKRNQIKEYLEEEKGFDCKIFPIESYKKYIEEYNEKTNINEFDLLIVDFKLDDHEVQDEHTGFDIIQDIRDAKKIYTEVIFYSSHYPDLISKLKSPDGYVEGVFTSARDELEIKVQEILDVIIKKVQDVNNLRGLIMAEVAELERIKERIIIKASPKISEKSIEKYVLNKIKSSGNSTKNRAERLLAVIDTVLFEELFKNIGFVDLDKKLHATGEILNKLSITTPISKDELIEPYKEKIRDIRNKFAHVEESDGVDEYGLACKVIGDVPFTEENCINIRKEIKKYKGILTTIEQQV